MSLLQKLFQATPSLMPESDAQPIIDRHLRGALRAARDEKVRAETEVAESKSAVERVQAVIAAVNTASLVKDQAAAALTSTARAWATRGASGELGDEQASQTLREATQALDLAERRAEGARDALAACRQRESRAKEALKAATQAERSAAIAVVLSEECEPRLNHLEETRAAYLEARSGVDAVRRFLEDRRFYGDDGNADLLDRLTVLTGESREKFRERCEQGSLPAAKALNHALQSLLEDPTADKAHQ
jgi:DNA-dependent RNA polymerase auxiliary subunit epsilon